MTYHCGLPHSCRRRRLWNICTRQMMGNRAEAESGIEWMHEKSGYASSQEEQF